MRPSRDLLAVTASITLASAGATAQEPPRLWSVEADLAAFGIDAPADVQRGRVSLVHDPAGDRIALHFLRTVPVGAEQTPAAVELPGVPPGGAPSPNHTGMWVWNTAEILSDHGERARFLDFVEGHGIDRVFLYIPAAEGERPEAGFIPFDGDALAPLLGDLRARGALTYALDGDPSYVLEENRDGILRTVRRVAQHNRSHPPEQGFYGVRYDIEPYLLPGFQGPRRAEILSAFASTLQAISRRARESGLAVGFDVPFWLDGFDEETGERFEVEVGDQRYPIMWTVLQASDDIGIMAYRTRADGPDGVLAQVEGEIAHSSRGSVFIGVETTRLNDEELYTFRGGGRVGLPPLPDAPWVLLEDLGGGRVRVWLAEGPDALAELERRVGSVERLRYWFAGQPVPLPGDRLSFYGLGADAMEAVTDEILAELGDDPAFLGLAYHDYRGLSALLGR